MANFTPQELEEILQAFFDVTGKRQYVGARYVPIFGRKNESSIEWENSAPYESLTVVMHNGVSYVSRKYVPTGIEITDTEFWAETYRFNAQVEQYRQEVLGFDNRINENKNAIEEETEAREQAIADALATVAEETEAREQAIADALATVDDEYVPLPDSDTYPKHGTSGQVLSTLGDGATKWENPVIVDAAIAEPLIQAWLNAHPEATTTVLDGSITNVKLSDNNAQILDTSVNLLPMYISEGASSIPAPYNDFNTLPINRGFRVALITNPTTPIANKPEITSNYEGMVITISTLGFNLATASATHVFQMLIPTMGNNANNVIWYRAKYSSWTPWRMLNTIVDGEITNAKLSPSDGEVLDTSLNMLPMFVTEAASSIAAPYDDLNTYPINRAVRVLFDTPSTTPVANKPDGIRSYEGILVTLSTLGFNRATSTATHVFQMLLPTMATNERNIIYYRSKYANWTPWRKLNQEAPPIYNQFGNYRGLKDFDVLGDSISVSLSYPTNQRGITVESWAKIMAKTMVGTASVHAQGGRTTGGMIAAADYQDVVDNSNGNQFAMICLGINDINQNVSDSVFIANYNTLITDMLTHHKFVFCSKIPKTLQSNARTESLNALIENIASNYANAFVVDPEKYNELYSAYYYNGHLSSVGYAGLAEAMSMAINDAMAVNTFFTHASIDA